MAVLRLIFVGFFILTIIYGIAALYSRSVRKAKLAQEWDTEIQQGDRDAFIREGLREYSGSFRRKLLFGIYIVPVLVILTIIYITNFVN
ncbi:hypothetical protein [Parasulfitobacter algicola]|uniref:Cation/multidrug efflux pump n=1 Tax=Parasulfitobacter algicola TaxID=2614809 RepID=A0ABX2IKM4_9RHOB|nr:hypothetical protein [Sulfitobacter algicola]NSX53432.1 hypothetical protein [Sulfitobacter algicola]